MQIGVIIEKGPQNWQIIQQNNGSADIQLSGKWISPDQTKKCQVFIRVVSEDRGHSIIPWMKCEHFENDSWKVTIKDVPIGGLYRIETCLNHEDCRWEVEWALRGDMIHHLGVGDLYVVAGQSNSAGYGKDPVNDPPEIGVHLLRNSGKWDLASHPLNESTDMIHEENREGGNPGHSPYLNFAKILKKELGYPVGLIQASLGGSPLSAWNPEEDGILYRNMMNIIKPQGDTVKGILWYQGCSDTTEDQCYTYLKRFRNMVSSIRRDLNNEKLPVLTVQLNRCLSPGNEINDICWGKIREAQRQAPKVISNIYVVPAIDCTMSDGIHNTSASNMVLGERLAKVALSEIYGKKYLCKAPDLMMARQVDRNQVILVFENVYERLCSFDQIAKELPFTFKDGQGEVEIIDYEIKDKNAILVTFNRELNGKSQVHGAFEMNPKTIIPIDIETHLPILSFYGMEVV